MSQPSSSLLEPPVFVAHALCPLHLHLIVEDAVEVFDNAWLLLPQQGEVFETAKAYLHCLQGYTLSQGFAVVTTSSKKTRVRFSYIYYSVNICNWYELEAYVEKDTKGNIVSRCKK